MTNPLIKIILKLMWFEGVFSTRVLRLILIVHTHLISLYICVYVKKCHGICSARLTLGLAAPEFADGGYDIRPSQQRKTQ